MATKHPTTKQTRSIRPRTRRISLAFMGPEFAEAFIDFRYPTWGDTEWLEAEDASKTTNAEANQSIVRTLQRFFYGGQIVDAEGRLIDMEAGDIDAFDLLTVTELFKQTMGIADPKAPEPTSAAPSGESFHEPTLADELAEEARVSTGASSA